MTHINPIRYLIDRMSVPDAATQLRIAAKQTAGLRDRYIKNCHTKYPESFKISEHNKYLLSRIRDWKKTRYVTNNPLSPPLCSQCERDNREIANRAYNSILEWMIPGVVR